MGGMDMERRELLRLMGTAAAAAAGTAPGVFAAPSFKSDPFGLGVASGSPDHRSVVLWTRLHDQGLWGSHLPDAPIPVKWEVALDERFGRVLAAGEAMALPELAHSVHVEAGPLPANTVMYYRFMAGGAVSPVGRTRSLPAPGDSVARWRVALASCQHYERGYFGAYAHLVNDAPDLVIFLGDYIYEYPPARASIRSVEGSWCLTLADYRARYATYRKDPHLQAAHRAAAWCLTWDDHEVQNDYAGTQAGNRGPVVADFIARRSAAYQAYYEHMPLRPSVLVQGLQRLQQGGELRLYAHHRIGRLVNLSLLDNRQYRHPQVCTANGELGSSGVDRAACAALRDPARSLLGATQEQWLLRQHPAGDARWNLLANATLFGQRVYGSATRQRVSNDGWDGYPLARQRIIDHFAAMRENNLLVIGGDIHENWIGHVLQDYDQPRSESVGAEFCVGAVASYRSNASVLETRRRLNPHFVYGDSGVEGYGLLDLMPDSVEMRVRAVDDSRNKDPGIRTAAAFRIQQGQARLESLAG